MHMEGARQGAAIRVGEFEFELHVRLFDKSAADGTRVAVPMPTPHLMGRYARESSRVQSSARSLAQIQFTIALVVHVYPGNGVYREYERE